MSKCRSYLPLWLLCAAAGAFGQSSGIEQLDKAMRDAERQYILKANPALNIGERAIIEYGGQANFNFFAIDDTKQRTHLLRQSDVLVFGRVNIDQAHEFFGRIHYTYRDFDDGDSFDGAGDSYLYPLIDRWHYKFDLARAIAASEGEKIDYNLQAQVGRQYVEWGSGLVFSDQLYALKGRASFGPLALDFLAGVTPRSSVIDLDSSRPSFDGDTSRGFYGGMVTWNGMAEHRPYGFFLSQIDYNTESDATFAFDANPLNDVRTRFDYNSNYVGIGSTGRFFFHDLSYQAEFVYEFGDNLSSSVIPGTVTQAVQTREDISAWAAKAGLIYLLRDENFSRLEFETILASGDSNREKDTSNTFGGNLSGTRDTAFNAFGFAKTGLAFDAPISNLMLFRVGGSTFPLRTQGGIFKYMQVGMDFLFINKMDSQAPIDEPTQNGGSSILGFEPDFFLAWRLLSDVVFNMRYGVFFPGDAIEGDRDARHFFYTGVSYSF